ncbi:MAG: hypothetical protein JF616_12225 [Fibrobacteres bacterium]|nr:hypothetical protein [Fibrobacterota bacterium]
MKPLELQALPAEAWRPSVGANGRVSNRVSERELERIPSWLVSPDGRESRVTLWDFSPHGFAVLQGPETVKGGVNVGDRVRIRLEADGNRLEAECRVANISMHKGKSRIGLSRRDLDRRVGPDAWSSTPHGELLRIPKEAELIAEAENPLFFGERSQLRLCGLRPGLRFDFLAEDPAQPLFRGQRLKLHLLIPTTGECAMEGRIESLELAPGARIKVRVRAERLGAGLANDLAEALAYEYQFSPESLRRMGLPIRIFRNRIEFRFVETMDDYAQVLALRRNAYVDVGKREARTSPEEMSLAWDKRSRILCFYYKGTLVASAALTFPASETEVMRSETAFPGHRFPGNPPPRTRVMEVNSLCTHKDYRRGDLLHAVFEQIARIFVLSDRDYIMNLSDDTLLPMYLDIGFKAPGYVGDFLGRPHHLIRVPKETVTHARGIGLLRWNILYGDLMRELAGKGLVRLTRAERWALRLRLALGPLAEWLMDAKNDKAIRKAATAAEG